jgi:hypothetical protein
VASQAEYITAVYAVWVEPHAFLALNDPFSADVVQARFGTVTRCVGFY